MIGFDNEQLVILGRSLGQRSQTVLGDSIRMIVTSEGLIGVRNICQIGAKGKAGRVQKGGLKKIQPDVLGCRVSTKNCLRLGR